MRHVMSDALPCQARSNSLDCETVFTSHTYRVSDQYQGNLNRLHFSSRLQLKKSVHFRSLGDWSANGWLFTLKVRVIINTSTCSGMHHSEIFSIHQVSLKFLHKHLYCKSNNGSCALDGLLNDPSIKYHFRHGGLGQSQRITCFIGHKAVHLSLLLSVLEQEC